MTPKDKHVYVATSWRNERQPEVVAALRDMGYGVYDFREPTPNHHGFHWEEVSRDWQNWTPQEHIAGLDHELAVEGFERDMEGLAASGICAMLMPCGRSAHIEAGWAKGSGRTLYVILSEGAEPELMIKMADKIFPDLASFYTHMQQLA